MQLRYKNVAKVMKLFGGWNHLYFSSRRGYR